MKTKKMRKTEILAMAAAALLAAALLAVGAFAQSGQTFRFFGPLSRVLTPNQDHVNDLVVFCAYNPAGSDVSGKIYSLLGSEVATMSSPVQDPPTSSCTRISNDFRDVYLTWDGRSNGTTVHSGIYVYRITSELHSYTGTLIVVR